MNILFIHQNFPGQFGHIAKLLARDKRHRVIAIGHFPELQNRPILKEGIEIHGYPTPRAGHKETHHYLRDFEIQVRRGQQVVAAVQLLLKGGFNPDLVVAHPAWGEALFLKDLLPKSRHIHYFEYYYQGMGGDVGFDPEFPATLDDLARVRVKNSTQLLSLTSCDAGISPTHWQKERYPTEFHSKIKVIHEGINTATVAPNSSSSVNLSGRSFTQDDEVVTYVARNLEPYRGFHILIRALPALQSKRPNAHVIIVGGDDVSYGRRPPDGQTYREMYCNEVMDRVDWSRVHFTGKLSYQDYLKVLQISSCHLYLTYPFVLSWSMLEAMSAGCLLVASNTPPVKEVIKDQHDGLLVDFFDIDKITDTVAEVLANPDRYNEIRKNARQTVIERFDLDRVCLPSIKEYLLKV
jgi:glycosyltransferase involved in cell wall biosynthesis